MDDKTKYWQAMGVRAKHRPPTSYISRWDCLGFADLNGDVRFPQIPIVAIERRTDEVWAFQGRDDFYFLNDGGMTNFWTNSRSCLVGKADDGLNVAWRKALGTEGEKYTHGGLVNGYYDYEDVDFLQRIHFARIYGTKPAFGNLGVADYVFMERVAEGDKFRFKVHVSKNLGAGATKLEMDGNKYCNMAGHTDGRMDYVWTYSTGKMHSKSKRGGECDY